MSTRHQPISHNDGRIILRHLGGYRRGRRDPRDHLLASAHPYEAARLPPQGSTRTVYAPPIRDQGQIGSCTANAGCTAAGFLYHAQTSRPDPLFSRLDLYAGTRELEGTPLREDSGCSVRDVFKAMSRFGVCLEKTWPYVESHFSQPPPRQALAEALQHRAIMYLSCRTLDDIRASIAAGFPTIGGFTCYESLQSEEVGRTGDVPFPVSTEAEIGGHCVYFDGYDDAREELTFQNSWGPSWGTNGYGTLPYRYVREGLADDFWSLRRAKA